MVKHISFFYFRLHCWKAHCPFEYTMTKKVLEIINQEIIGKSD